MAGFLPFSAIYIELHYIFASVWGHKLYTLYGVLFVAFGMLVIVTSFITVALTYFQLAIEDHRCMRFLGEHVPEERKSLMNTASMPRFFFSQVVVAIAVLWRFHSFFRVCLLLLLLFRAFVHVWSHADIVLLRLYVSRSVRCFHYAGHCWFCVVVRVCIAHLPSNQVRLNRGRGIARGTVASKVYSI